MLVKLKIIKETEKAYQLEGNGWIPKSILNNEGLKHPYYQIKDWWLEKITIKGFEKVLTLQEKITINCLSNCKINFIDLPLEIREYWSKYWKNTYNSLPPLRNKQKSSSLNHYNDIGAMNDLTFQDVYGDFGY